MLPSISKINPGINKWNPFSGLIHENYLFNIATGKADHEETAIFLLDVMETGTKTLAQFFEDFVKDSRGFS